MKPKLILFLLSILPFIGWGQQKLLEKYQWEKRVILLLVETEEDPKLASQLMLLEQNEHAVKERDLVILTVLPKKVSENGYLRGDIFEAQALRKKYHATTMFTLVLIGKDGTPKLRHPYITAPKEIFDLIDRMPMRQQEVKNKTPNSK